jgi:transcriptional regulator with XRE-family HTH domain
LDALATQLGISYQQVQKYERGENRIGAGRLPHIARVLGCSVEDLVPSTLVSQTDESSPVSSGVEERGVALQRALAKPEVVRAALLFDAIQAADQRETALAVLEGLGRVPGDAKA